jgi:hypothetical protein
MEMYGEFEAHPAADLFPMMTDAELDDLATDIRANGQLETIRRYEGKILDGRNRYRACERVGITPKIGPVFMADGQTPTEWVISKNLKRRHLTTGQRAMVATKAEAMIAAEISDREAKRKIAEEAKKAAERSEPSPSVRPTTRNSVESSKPKVAERAPEAVFLAGKATGVSGDSVRTAKKIKKADPALADKVASGEMTLNAAEKQLNGPESVVSQTTRLMGQLRRLVAEVEGDPLLYETFAGVLRDDQALTGSLTKMIEKDGS